MGSKKKSWHQLLPGGKSPPAYSFDELRAAKQVDAFLRAELPGPAGLAEYIRGFQYLLFFGVACVAANTYPPLTRCWRDLERRFMQDPAFDDGVFVQGWALIDFPFGPAGETALDYFEKFIEGTEASAQLQRFIDAARRSRLGLHQDVRRTAKLATFRELMSGEEIAIFPSIVEYGKGEILLVRMITHGSDIYVFGNPKGFPASAANRIKDMVLDRLFGLETTDFTADPTLQYGTFMKLAGPYWMSCVCTDQDAPVLDPDHYRSYLDA